MMMKRAIVLADQRSPRRVNGSGHLKTLAKVGGLPLLIRNLRTLKAAGVQEAVVVIGYEAERVRAALQSYHLGIDVTVVNNPDWHLGTAHSLNAAAAWVEDQAVLVPSDHLYPPSLLRRMIGAPLPVDTVLLAVDRRMDEVFDEEECLKVRLDGDRVSDIGVGLAAPDGVCPGIVRISRRLVDTLGRLLRDADVDLVDALRTMARQGRVRTLDVAHERWISISSPQARRYADLLLQLHGDTLETTYHGEHAVLLNPGPVVTTPRVKAAVGARDICHREPVFTELLDSVQRKLGRVFGATDDHDVLVVTASGTGGMEAALCTFVPRGRRLLVLQNGAFGERLAEIGRAHEIDVAVLGGEWGAVIDPAEVERALDADPGIAAVAMIHHETSIGVLNPVARIGELTRARGMTLIVDTVSSMGAEDIDVERDNIDVCITSANKCLHAFSGLASICVRRQAWEAIEHDRPRGYYFDLRRYRKFMVERRQTPFTPAVNTMLSLNAALDELLDCGLEGRREHYRRLNERIRRGLSSLGFRLLVDPERSSHSLTIVEVPAGMTYQEIYEGFKERGFIVYESKAHLAGRTFQVANMGALEEAHVDDFVAAAASLLEEHHAKLPSAGSADQQAAVAGLRMV
jgi:2-aminoethylphosphonate-pyruvate transaminase